MEKDLQLCHQPQWLPEDRNLSATYKRSLNPIGADSLSGRNTGYIHTAAQIAQFWLHVENPLFVWVLWIIKKNKNGYVWFLAPMDHQK